MSATILIDQAGLAAGTPGESRTDGLDNALVTLTSVNAGSETTWLWRIVSVAPEGESAPTLTNATSSVATFTPNPTDGATYLIELVVDSGLPTESVSRRIFAIRTTDAALRYITFSELSDPENTIQSNDSDASTDNEGGSWRGWADDLNAWLDAIEDHEGRIDTLEGAGGGLPADNVNDLLVGTGTGFTTLGPGVIDDVLGIQPDGSVGYRPGPKLNGFRDRSETTLSWDRATRTVSIDPSATAFVVYVDGQRFNKLLTGDSVVIPDTTGLHVVYYDETGTLVSSLESSITEDIILRDALVAIVYWNATQGREVLFGDERHGTMDAEAHSHFHNAFGAQIERDSSEGKFTLLGIEMFGNGDQTGSAQIAMEAGTLLDEDLRLTTAETSQVLGTPAASNPLDSPPIAGAVIPTLFRTGATGEWNIQDDGASTGTGAKTVAIPMLDTTVALPTYGGGVGGRQPFNEFTGTTWQLTEAGSGNHVLLHLFAWNSTTSRVVAVLGQNEYASAGDARDAASTEMLSIQLTGMPFPEFRPLYTLVMDVNTGFDNEASARFEPVDSDQNVAVDWRFALGSAGGAAGSSGIASLQAAYNGGSDILLTAGTPVSITAATAGDAALDIVTGRLEMPDGFAIGQGAAVAETESVVIGRLARTVTTGTTTRFSTVIGDNASVTDADSAVAIGRNASIAAGAVDSIAIGFSSSVGAGVTSGIAIGTVAAAPGNKGIAIGENATALAGSNDEIAIGRLAAARGTEAIALGHGSQTGEGTGPTGANFTVAIGGDAHAEGGSSIAIGKNSATTDSQAVAIGEAALAATRAVAIGDGATASSADAIAIGVAATASTQADAIAIGGAASATGLEAIAIGELAQSTSTRSVAIGPSAQASGSNSFAMGLSAVANSTNATALGAGATAVTRALALGAASEATTECVAIGEGADALGAYSVVIGQGASGNVSATNSIAIGHDSQVAATQAIAIGRGATADLANRMVVGSDLAPVFIAHIGRGIESATPNTNVQIHATNASAGSARDGSNLVLKGGDGDGAGVDGEVRIVVDGVTYRPVVSGTAPNRSITWNEVP